MADRFQQKMGKVKPRLRGRVFEGRAAASDKIAESRRLCHSFTVCLSVARSRSLLLQNGKGYFARFRHHGVFGHGEHDACTQTSH